MEQAVTYSERRLPCPSLYDNVYRSYPVKFGAPETQLTTEGGSTLSSTRRHSSQGQAIAEFALLVPVLLLLMLVAVDFGRLFFTYISVNNVAREATYYAAAHAADDKYVESAYFAAVRTAGLREVNVQGQGGEGALTVSNPVCFTPGSETTLDCDTASNFATGSGNQVTVSASQPFTFLTPFVGELFGGSLTLTASATGPVLNPINPTVIENPDAPPVASCPEPLFTWELAAEPLTVAFTDASTGGPTSWVWDFGDEQTSTDQNPPDHEYSRADNYTVRLTVDECDFVEQIVTVGDASPPDPDPDPINCVVPSFIDQWWDNVDGVKARDVWKGRGFTPGMLKNEADKNQIKSQTLIPGSTVLCTSGMEVRD